MLSMQHVLCGVLSYDDADKFKQQIGALVFPDAIRAYSVSRQCTHFERSEGGTDVSWWKMPTDMKTVTKELVQESLSSDSHTVSGIRPCVLGEDTDIQSFYKHNQHLPKDMFEGIEMHLRQDIAYDRFVREEIDCSRMYDDVFVRNGVSYDGKGVRSLIADMEQQGIYILAHDLYEKKGITANQEWFEENVKPVLDEAYPVDLADKTFGYMKLSPVYDEYITNHDWSHLNDGVVSYEDYRKFYDTVLADVDLPSGYEGIRKSRVSQAERLLPDVSDDSCDYDFVV